MHASDMAFNQSTIITRLEDVGFSPKQAQTITNVIIEVQDGSDLVTNAKQEIRLKELELRLIKWVATIVGVGVAILAILIEF